MRRVGDGRRGLYRQPTRGALTAEVRRLQEARRALAARLAAVEGAFLDLMIVAEYRIHLAASSPALRTTLDAAWRLVDPNGELKKRCQAQAFADWPADDDGDDGDDGVTPLRLEGRS